MTGDEILTMMLQGGGLGAGGTAAIWYLKSKLDGLVKEMAQIKAKAIASRLSGDDVMSETRTSVCMAHKAEIKEDIKEVHNRITSDKNEIRQELADIKEYLGEIKGVLSVISDQHVAKGLSEKTRRLGK
jgi:hypothetical protein